MKKKICVISPSLKLGGIERALSVLSNEFVLQGFEVVFLSCLGGPRFYELDEQIRVLEPEFSRKRSFFNKLTYYPRLLFFIRKTVKAENPDVVLSFGDVFNPVVLLALKGTGFPVYISDRTSPDYKFRFPIPLLKKNLYQDSAGFIAQTSRAAEYKKKQFGKRLNIRIISNALRPVTEFPEIKRKKVILYVGRFAWEKAPDKLIEAFAQLPNADDWILKMAGTGPMLTSMKKLSEELGIENRVLFLGQVTNVDALYAEAGIYVLPSVLEGFPNSLCEAMSAGLASVCFPTIAYEDIFIRPDMGVVCQDSKPETLAAELKILIDNPDLRKRLGENARLVNHFLKVPSIGEEYLKFMNLK